MAGELPPVVADILLNYEPFIAGANKVEDRTKTLMGYLDQIDSSTSKAAAGLDNAGASAEKAAGSLTQITGEADTASGGLDKVGESGKIASAGLDETAASADRANAAIARTADGRFKKVGEDAAGMGTQVDKAAKDTEKAQKDMETRSGGFSSKISSIFTHVGETMGNWGIPFSGSITKMGDEIDKAEAKGKGFQASMNAIGKTALVVGGVGLAAVAGEALKLGANFQESTDKIVTGAGESTKSINMVRAGILAMAGEVGQAPKALSEGMFMISSAGYHAAEGLNVLKASAEGAATGGAKMETVADAVTTALRDYSIPAAHATEVTSALVETVASGKTHLEALGSSLGRVMPTAAALGVSFQDLMGAEATLTVTGMSARLASMHLNNTLLAMSAPSSKATKVLEAVGLSAQQVKNALSENGLAGAIKLIEEHLGQRVPESSALYVDALKTMLGGTTGYVTALALGGKHAKEFAENVTNIGQRLGQTSSTVQGFKETQKTLNQQLAEAKGHLEAVGISLGQVLIPIINKASGVLAGFFQAVQRGNPIIVGIAAAIGGVLVLAITSYVAHLTVALARSALAFTEMAAGWAATAAKAAASAATQAASWLGVGTAANTAATETGAAETKMVAEVEAGDTAIEAANATVALSFTGIGTAAVAAGAVVYGAVKGMEAGLTAITGEAQKLNTLLGGNQPGEANKEGEGIAKAFNNKYSTGLKHQMGSSLGELGSGVEEEILKTAMAHGLSPAAAAAMVGNAAQESSLSPGAPGGGLYQMSGYPGRGTGNAQNQTEEAIQLMGSSVIAMMNAAKSPAEAANIMMKDWEKPKGSQPGEEAYTGIANPAHREQAATEAASKIQAAIGSTAPTTASSHIKSALEKTQATAAKKAIAEALAEAKHRIAELKATFTSAWGELAKTSEKLFKMMQAKGGIKTHELLGLEHAHELEEAKLARAEAEENVRKAESGAGTKQAEKELEVATRKETEAVNKLTDAINKLHTAERERQHGKGSKSSVESAKAGVESAEGSVTSAKETTANAFVAVNTAKQSQIQEIKSAQQALNNILYQEKVASLKKEAKAEETAIAHANAAKQAAFTAALNQLKAHLAHGKTSTEQAMKEIEKVLRKYGVTFGSVGKDAGQQWVKQFEEAIKKAAKDSGALSAEISADIKAGIKIPGLAVGGIVTAPTLAMIGEAGPEAVVPLNQLGGLGALGGGVAPLPAHTPTSLAAGTRGGLQVGEINLYGQNATSAELVRELYYQLRPMLVTS